VLKLSNFVTENDDLRKALIFCFHLKKSAVESHRMLVVAYGNHAISEATCKRWFQWFRDNDFDVLNEERGRPPKKFEDTELEAILDENETLPCKTCLPKVTHTKTQTNTLHVVVFVFHCLPLN